LSKLATSFVLGYHGCEKAVADKAVYGKFQFIKSKKDFDWLGNGAYFWESDPLRAKEWADWKVSRGDYKDAAVVGAVIDLANCLDLTNREDILLVKRAYDAYLAQQKLSGLSIPKNKSVNEKKDPDKLLRFLDCAVIEHLHTMMAAENLTPFDTVRALFIEGEPIYEGGGFHEKTHVQIAVRNNSCIKGIFFPMNLE